MTAYDQNMQQGMPAAYDGGMQQDTTIIDKGYMTELKGILKASEIVSKSYTFTNSKGVLFYTLAYFAIS